MKTLQEYLNNKYPTTSEKEAVIQISTVEIQEEREKQGLTDDLLEGAELDLREYLNVQEVIIDQQFLTTPLTKIETEGLTHLKEIIWNSEPPKPIDNEEDKKLWTELGISEESKENTAKKQVIREIKRLNELFSSSYLSGKKINANFATDKLPREELKEQLGMTEDKDGEFHVYLQLEQKDKQGNFSPNLIFWTFTQELTHTLIEKRFSPDFWQRFLFDEDSLAKWVSSKVNTDYQNLSLLTTPLNFPHQLLNIKESLKISFFDANLPQETINEQITVTSPLIDETWTIINKELINLTTQELIKGTEQEKLVQLLTLEYNQDEYTLNLVYHQENPLHEQISRLIITTPLKLEIENLKQKQNQLPTTENFDKLTKQNKELEDYLQDFTDEESYQKILTKINEIN